MRIDFKTFLTEQEEVKGKALKHLTHVEDHVIHGGHEGVQLADEHLRGMHDMLLGKNSKLHASTKYDGAPSIVFGTHPQTGQFFVASKSAFNKNPKINYTEEDIEKNHGHAPGLVEKLKHALKYLPGIMPRTGGVYQGDLMHTEGDVQTQNGKTSVTPNTLTYSAPADSVEGRNLNKKLGIVVHTQYKHTANGGRGGLESMNAGPLQPKDRAKFKEHPDVNNIDPTIEVNPSNYSPIEQQAFLNHMEKAKRVYSAMKPEAMEALAGHGEQMEAHVNNMIRTGGTPSVQGYMDHLTARHQKDVDKVKTEATKQKKIQAHADLMSHISKNREHFDKALKLHGHLQDAKNILTNVLAKNSQYEHSVAGEPTGPEGTVVVDKQGNASKFNNRREFNRLNFLKGAFQKQQVANAEVQ
jgi:hypothetical protein